MDCVTPPYWSLLTVAIKSCHKYCNYTVLQSGTNTVFCRHCPPNIICYDQLLCFTFSWVDIFHKQSFTEPASQRESIHIREMEKHQFIMKLFTGWSSLWVEWSTKWQLIDDFIAFLSSLFNISRLKYYNISTVWLEKLCKPCLSSHENFYQWSVQCSSELFKTCFKLTK